MKALVIDNASPEHARLRRLLDDAGRNGVAEGAAGILELLACRLPGELVLVQTQPQAAARSHLCAGSRVGCQQVPVGEVRYFLAEHKYVWVRSAHERLLIRDSLVSLAQEFADRFVRIHRNALVATRYLTGLGAAGGGRCHVSLAGIEETLPVSRRRATALRRLVRAEHCIRCY